jgi:hypothetical protein
MNRITITIHVDLPDGVVPSVDYGEPPLPEAPLPDMPALAAQTFAGELAGCPVHHVPWKTVPAGVSKKTGKAYEAFQACPEMGCNQKPAR